MMRLTVLILACGLAACGAENPRDAVASERPMRIVSLDFCADQYVLKLADPEQILAISPDGVKDFSYMREAAERVPTVRPIAEDVLILKPDLVVRSYGGGANAAAFFERAGIPVLQIGWANAIQGESASAIPQITQNIADGLGQSARGAALVREYTQRLEEIEAGATGKSTLYVTPGGVTSGGNSLIHHALLAAGLSNFIERDGWHSLPLERLAYERPELVATSFYDTSRVHGSRWSASRHPIAGRELSEAELVELKGAWTACGAWFVLDAIEAMAAGASD